MSDLNLNLSGIDDETLKGLKEGDRICAYVEGTVKANDGEMLSANITDVEPDPDKCGPADSDSEGSSDSGDQNESAEGEKPVAVIAMMGKKK